jgi:hypothetical protein
VVLHFSSSDSRHALEADLITAPLDPDRPAIVETIWNSSDT